MSRKIFGAHEHRHDRAKIFYARIIALPYETKNFRRAWASTWPRLNILRAHHCPFIWDEHFSSRMEGQWCARKIFRRASVTYSVIWDPPTDRKLGTYNCIYFKKKRNCSNLWHGFEGHRQFQGPPRCSLRPGTGAASWPGANSWACPAQDISSSSKEERYMSHVLVISWFPFLEQSSSAPAKKRLWWSFHFSKKSSPFMFHGPRYHRL